MGIEEVWQDYKKLIIYYLDVIKNGREQKKKQIHVICYLKTNTQKVISSQTRSFAWQYNVTVIWSISSTLEIMIYLVEH